MYLLNSFSLNMLADFNVSIAVTEISLEEARIMAPDCESAVGHEDAAAVFASQLELEVPMNRVTVSLGRGDSALVGQYRGTRLPAGATSLPEGAEIIWILVEIHE